MAVFQGADVEPRLVGVYLYPVRRGLSIEAHREPYDLIFLWENPAGIIQIGDQLVRPESDTLVLLKAGTPHSVKGDLSAGHLSKLWCVLYQTGAKIYRDLPNLHSRCPEHLFWKLNKEQVSFFKGVFYKLVAERAVKEPFYLRAESCWLRFLLLQLERWSENGRTLQAQLPENVPPEVLRLWETISDPHFTLNEEKQPLRELFPHYNVLRHQFKKIFGKSPQQMLTFIRIERSKLLLLNNGMTLKQIAAEVGFFRQHEFSRAFHHCVGMSPSEWRANARFIHGGAAPKLAKSVYATNHTLVA